jgi:hypothetical protein
MMSLNTTLNDVERGVKGFENRMDREMEMMRQLKVCITVTQKCEYPIQSTTLQGAQTTIFGAKQNFETGPGESASSHSGCCFSSFNIYINVPLIPSFYCQRHHPIKDLFQNTQLD